MEKIVLKKIKSEDWEEVLFFEKRCSSNLYHAITKESEVKKYVKDSVIYFIILKGKKIGTVSYELKKNNSAHIDGLTILPKYRGKGIATNAMKKLVKKLNNLDQINLDVHPHNSAAIILYLKNGFIIKKWNNNLFGKGEHRLFLVRSSK